MEAELLSAARAVLEVGFEHPEYCATWVEYIENGEVIGMTTDDSVPCSCPLGTLAAVVHAIDQARGLG